MKRRDLLKHLAEHGCVFKREGGRHSIYINTKTGRRTSVPRHNEVDDDTARGICKRLGIPKP